MKNLTIKYVDFPSLDEQEIKETKESFIQTVSEFLNVPDAAKFNEESSNFSKDNTMVFDVDDQLNVDLFMSHVRKLDDLHTMNESMYCGGWKVIDPITGRQEELPIHFAE